MKKIFSVATVILFTLCAVPMVEAQYARRDVKPPVPETGAPSDPSTPLGKVQEIAERLEKIETATEEINAVLEANKVPTDYKRLVDEILEAAGTTRAEVARLGEIAAGVQYIAAAVETIEANTAATGAVAQNVGTIAEYLKFVPTIEQTETRFKEQQDAISQAFAEYNAAFSKAEEERAAFEQALAAYFENSTEDASALKKKLETSSNIIILLGLGIIALFVVNVGKFVYDKVQQTKNDAKQRETELQEIKAALGSTSRKNSTTSK